MKFLAGKSIRPDMVLLDIAVQAIGIGSDWIIGSQNMIDLRIDNVIIQSFCRMIDRAQRGKDAGKKSIDPLNQQFPGG